VSVDRSEIDSRQYPEWAEFEEKSEVLTEVRPREGFYLKHEGVGQNWRFREDGATMYVEYYNGSAWVEKGKFTA